MAETKQLLLIGCGNMAGAMLAGWLDAGLDPARFAILAPRLEKAPDGVALYREVDEAAAAGGHDGVMLGFKPQQLDALAPGFQAITENAVSVYSLLAGLTLAQIQSAFPSAHAHVRVMPNLAARINKSPVILHEKGLSAQERNAAFALFDALGTALWLEDESKFDLMTALAGSGPGFVYRFIDALAQAAANLGLEQEQATALAIAAVDGASTLAAGAAVSPGMLADKVASPGGMTRQGMNVLDDEEALVQLLTKTLNATATRGAELSAGSK